MSTVYQRKLYALLRRSPSHDIRDDVLNGLNCFLDLSAQSENAQNVLPELDRWWNGLNPSDSSDGDIGRSDNLVQRIASSSDRVNLHATGAIDSNGSVSICHPISGESGQVEALPPVPNLEIIPESIRHETNAKRVFWWFWRFYPELWLNQREDNALADGLLYPAHHVLPDCPLHSYQATVSALTGAMFPKDWQSGDEPIHPYLLIFTFSPIQDFIKASRKFLDFWAGSYLLHYLSARLCWHIADTYGPDAVIVPSLWGQDIIDAFMLTEHEGTDYAQSWKSTFKIIGDQKTPVERFNDRGSTSLSTAGFPNVITALVPGKESAVELGNDLAKKLKAEWLEIGKKVRNDIRDRVSTEAADILNNDQQWEEFWAEVQDGLPDSEAEAPYRSDLEKWRSQENQHGNTTHPCWEWCKLWDAQLENAWEPYWAAVPLGDSDLPLEVSKANTAFNDTWKKAQHDLSQAWITIPSEAEEHAFDKLNVGSWWGSFQQRLRIAIQAVKNTRTWNIPVAPGERSTISGQYSAVHPNLNYGIVQRRGEPQDFREGAGVPEGSMRLFWLLMSKAYPGLFSGSERLNALELTKRMAWQFGGVADTLGIPTTIQPQNLDPDDIQALNLEDDTQSEPIDYEQLVRFPNLSSIAAARFVYDEIAQEDPQRPLTSAPRRYWKALADAVRAELGNENKREMRRRLASRTRCRAFQVSKTDRMINPEHSPGRNFNGVMFSSKWLADDMGLEENHDIEGIRRAVQTAHQSAGFGDGSPSDWWAVVLADGDSMGQYISGSKLEPNGQYINHDVVDSSIPGFDDLCAQKKRMGPATHIGLNRALLDFSNRLVPYLTEKRFCGKVIYSGGDDVMAVLPLEDLPGYLRSLRAAWSGLEDPYGEFEHRDGYWRAVTDEDGNYPEGVPKRPLFTMGNTATMSMGVVIAHKSVPLPTVLENLWTAEGDRAKEMYEKDGICFRVIYGGGNTLEALMKGELLENWWAIAQQYQDSLGQYRDELSPLLYRLAEELPKRVDISHPDLFALAARVIMSRRDEDRQIEDIEIPVTQWLDAWAQWANNASHEAPVQPGATSEDLGYLLRFTAFWIDKMVQREKWKQPSRPSSSDGRQTVTSSGGVA